MYPHKLKHLFYLYEKGITSLILFDENSKVLTGKKDLEITCFE